MTVYRPAPSQRAEPHCQPCFFPVLHAVLTAELYQYAFPYRSEQALQTATYFLSSATTDVPSPVLCHILYTLPCPGSA